MDEKTWDETSDAGAMLGRLRGSRTTSARKLRLFACAAVRRVWGRLAEAGSRDAVEVAERFADDLATGRELREAARQAAGSAAVSLAHMAASLAATGNYVGCAAAAAFASAVSRTAGGGEPERAAQCRLLRDIFANPFRGLPAVSPSVLRWQDGLVVRLARASYDGRVLPEGLLDPARLAVLADALEDAGYTGGDVLGHLRQPGAGHVRGCHVVDWILSEE